MGLGHPIIAVVTRETRLAGLKARWATARQAAFRLQLTAALRMPPRGMTASPPRLSAFRFPLSSQSLESGDTSRSSPFTRTLTFASLSRALSATIRKLVTRPSCQAQSTR